MPKCKFIIEGDIGDFTRIDNLYRTMKREGDKMLTDWTINLDIQYTEKRGEGEVSL